jgi:glycosyltransferase involved in cell wall biosynthesis
LPRNTIVQTAATIRCSVVLPTGERPLLLERTLDALVAQTLASHEYEIIVCDDGASEHTRSVVERCRQVSTAPIRYVAASPSARGLAAMRNVGLKISRGEIIAFTDDDTIPDSDWLRQGLLALESDGAEAATGRVVVPLSDESADCERDAAAPEQAAVAANFFCRRWALACVGGFDTRVGAPRREDGDLSARIVEAGFDVIYATDAVVVLPVARRSLDADSERAAALVMRRWTLTGGRDASRLSGMVLTSLVLPLLSMYERLRGAR